MEPISEVVQLLLKPSGIAEQRITRFSCGHVIPESHLNAMIIGKDPNGKDMNFSFKNRDSGELIRATCTMIVDVSGKAPKGIVCFFPSYDYESKIAAYFEKNGFKQMSVIKLVLLLFVAPIIFR